MSDALRRSYDAVPYPDKPRPATHPDHLAALARLVGLSPAPARRCRVLELGCAAGANLWPMAQYLPESEFVGADFSPVQIENGRRFVAWQGLWWRCARSRPSPHSSPRRRRCRSLGRT